MNTIIFIMAMAGVVLHLLVKVRDARTVKEPFNWKDHGLYAVISLILVTVIIVGWPEAQVFFGFSFDLNNFTAFLIGYVSDSLVKNLSTFNPLLAAVKKS